MNNEICSFEISRILQEKGFNEPCTAYYFFEELRETIVKWFNTDARMYSTESKFCTAPTIYQAAKYLRKYHNIHIYIDINQVYYAYNIKQIPTGNKLSSAKIYESYEEAFKEGLTYIIKNLI